MVFKECSSLTQCLGTDILLRINCRHNASAFMFRTYWKWIQ